MFSLTKSLFALLFTIMLVSESRSQNLVLSFDGQDDYVEFHGWSPIHTRTIELWFQLAEPVNNSLDEEIVLLNRISWGSLSRDFALTFSDDSDFAGRLKWTYGSIGSGQKAVIYSNDHNWEAARWYNVAIVIHEEFGLMMFVDGKKQFLTSEYDQKISHSDSIVVMGRNNLKNTGHFHGKIDAMRFSTEDLYASDYTPPCPDLPNTAQTRALWNCNEGSDTLLLDEGAEGYHGRVFGATWVEADPCSPVSVQPAIAKSSPFSDLVIFPQPAQGEVTFRFSATDLAAYELVVFNTLGQPIHQQAGNSGMERIDVGNLSPGLYHYHLTSQSGAQRKGSLVIQ